jgi:hypothetical protein
LNSGDYSGDCGQDTDRGVEFGARTRLCRSGRDAATGIPTMSLDTLLLIAASLLLWSLAALILI